ncbi:glycosyltransferase family 8 protein [Phascolarctobacterium faecium]|uniref:glycosyltransferase family 8 protein n=1 Tax=Phascolarctobacterium faecium TaxID=33025 RepID=UPI003AB6F121
MKKRTLHFGFGVDANYVKYAGVLMTNLVVLHPDRELHFHLACDGIEANDRHKLEIFRKIYGNVRITVYEMQDQLDALKPIKADAPTRLNRSVLLRILLPQMLNIEVERMVYMDVDVICLQRLDELFEIALQGCPVAAVLDTKSIKNAARLQLDSGRYCFAGVLVLDLVIWRCQKLTTQMTEYYQQYNSKLNMLEQDALNAVLNGAFLELDKRFNFLIEVNNPLMAVYPANTALLHCVNEAKAWTHGCLPEIRELYWRYVRQSPWCDLQPVEPTTVKAAFLAGTTAELQNEYEQARKYYVVTINSFTKHYQNTMPQLLETARQECMAAALAERRGNMQTAVRYYGMAAKHFMEQYLRDNPELAGR